MPTHIGGAGVFSAVLPRPALPGGRARRWRAPVRSAVRAPTLPRGARPRPHALGRFPRPAPHATPLWCVAWGLRSGASRPPGAGGAGLCGVGGLFARPPLGASSSPRPCPARSCRWVVVAKTRFVWVFGVGFRCCQSVSEQVATRVMR